MAVSVSAGGVLTLYVDGVQTSASTVGAGIVANGDALLRAAFHAREL